MREPGALTNCSEDVNVVIVTNPSGKTAISAQRSLEDTSVVHTGTTTCHPPDSVSATSVHGWVQISAGGRIRVAQESP